MGIPRHPHQTRSCSLIHCHTQDLPHKKIGDNLPLLLTQLCSTNTRTKKGNIPTAGNPEGVRSGTAGITQEPHCQMKSYTEIRTREFENTSYPLRAVLGLPAPHVLPQLCCLPSSSMVSFSSQPCPCRFFISGLMSPAPKASQRLPKGLHGHQGGNPSLSGRQEPLQHH